MKRLVCSPAARLIVMLLAWRCSILSSPPQSLIAADHLEEFSVGRGGRPVLVPVTLDGRQHLFAVDTGTAITAFDASLKARLGKRTRETKVRTPAGIRPVTLYECPRAAVGRLPMDACPEVAAYDLKPIRLATGQEIYGVLGMDFLRQFVVQFDFDHGTLKLAERLEAFGEEPGAPLPIRYNPDGCPTVAAKAGDAQESQFTIDTGSTWVTIQEGAFDRLAKSGDMLPGSSSFAATVAGSTQADSGKLLKLAVDGHAAKDIRCVRDPVNALGLRFLVRFVVTADFPGKTLHLRASEAFANPDPPATSGLVLNQREGRTVVVMVKDGSPAATGGVREGDEILAISGQPISRFDLFDIGKALTSQVGKRVSLLLHRADRDVETQLILADAYQR